LKLPARLLAAVVATWFGCGYAPAAPGTAGSVCAVVIAWLVPLPPLGFGLLALLLAGPAMWAAEVTARASGLEDPPIVVVDEVVGQWLALAGATTLNWKSRLGALVLFRLFDIWKPAPARQLERLPGGLGIVADDVIAGLYAALVLFAAGWFNLY
jgi:phosphatidylglycerophosphatase A